MRRAWRWRGFDASIRGIDSLTVSIDTDDERVVQLVEQAAAAHGIDLERLAPVFYCEPDESGGLRDAD